MRFLAIDFETANFNRDSACALGVVLVEDLKITKSESMLIRPPTRYFKPEFIKLHGITWSMVKEQPTFKQHWPAILKLIKHVDFLVAHNATFDIGVIMACCRTYRIATPLFKHQCTMLIAREKMKISPVNLPNVCSELGIKLNHHDPKSDAVASAKIMIKYLKGRRRK
jgi:DNA polymerase-3 subunit epsilon